ncbi:MAG TPA: ROK family protein [Candidatus Limnocylindrales bacterium]
MDANDGTGDLGQVASGRIAIGVDVGGSGIKAAVVDVESGRFRSERLRVPTPKPSGPGPVCATIGRLVRRLAKDSGISDTVPVGVGLPGVAMHGRLLTAANIDSSWVDFPVADQLSEALHRPVAIVNDADAAGIAEMRFGVGAGRRGVVIFLTLGTGVGSGTFVDGVLVPNTEFGQMEIRGRPAERRSASAARIKRSLSWKAWAMDLDEHLQRIEELMWPELFIVGGGVSKNADRFLPRLNRRTPIVAATLRNDAGIIGAAIVAAEGIADASTTFDDLPAGPPAVEPPPAEQPPAESLPARTQSAPGETAS